MNSIRWTASHISFFNSHDQARTWDRFGDGIHNDQIAKLMVTLLLTTRATPQMYYGDELGMRTTIPTRKENVKDPVGRTGWPKDKGRDGERTPMQWDTTANAGFSTNAKTWLPVPRSAALYNVATEERDPDSILNFYRRLIALRRELLALRDGQYVAVNGDDQNVLAYLRKVPDGTDSVPVMLNMSAAPRAVNFKLAGFGVHGTTAQVLLASPQQTSSDLSLDEIKLAPCAVVIATVK